MFLSTRSPKGLGHRAALGCLAACHLAVWGGVFLRSRTVLSSPLGDLDRHFMDWRIFAADQLRQGILPLWTPATLNGTPFLGGFESALFYPFNWLFTVLPPAPAANLVVLAQVLLAGFFTYGWASSRGLRPVACLLAGGVASLGGPLCLQVYAGHLSNLCAMAWIPFLFWAFDEFMRRPSGSWALGLALGSCLQGSAGHPQYVYETAILLGLYAALSGALRPERRGPAALAAAAYASGYLLSAAQWLPGLQALEGSARGGLWDPKTSALFSLPPENLLTLFLPGFFGPPGSPLYWGRWYLWDVSLFMGFTPLLLALHGIFRRGGSRNADLGTAAAALLLALGPATPIFHFLFKFLPGFHSLRGSCKFDFFITLFLGLLAASGLDRLLTEGRPPKGWARWLGLTALGAAGLGLGLRVSAAKGLAGTWGIGWADLPWLKKGLAYLDPAQLDLFARGAGARAAESLFGLALTAAVLALAAAWVSRTERRGWFPYIVGLVAAVELMAFAFSNRAVFDWGERTAQMERVADFYRAHPGDYRVFGTESDAALEGGRDLWDQEPLIPERYARFVARTQGFPPREIFRTSPVFHRFGPIFALTRLRYLFEQGPAGLPKVLEQPTAPLGRVVLYHGFQKADPGDAALDRSLAPDFDWRRQLVLESDPDPMPEPARRKERLAWRELSVDRLAVEASLSAPGLLLVTDNFDPGWKAFQGGTRLWTGPADGFLWALALPAGRSRVDLVYAPDAFRVGLWISLVSLLFSIVILASVLRTPAPGPRRK